MPLSVAVIGSGPAGYYTTEALVKDLGEAVRIDIIDRLPTPYGLIRGGVAPDHQSIKAVAKRFEKTNSLDNVRFLGNVAVGEAVSVEELRQLYDAVVLAVGAPVDRRLGIPGDDLPGVIGSAQFVGWYNAHPDFADLDPDLDIDAAAVIGNGNVAIDCARVLAKTPAEMATSDLAPHAARRIHASPLRTIHLFGRRGPLEASFTPKELGELGELDDCAPIVDPGQLPSQSDDMEPVIKKNLAHLHAFSGNRPGLKRKTLDIVFYARPVAVLGDGRVTGLKLERTQVVDGRCLGTGATFEVACGLVIPCIGYVTPPLPGVPHDQARGCFANKDGVIAPGLYCTGWARRGPSGTIGTNRPDGFEVAGHIGKHIAPSGKQGGAGLDALLRARAVAVISFADWKRIEAAEIDAAVDGAPRRKFATRADLMAALKRPGQAAGHHGEKAVLP
ncbi:MAG: FAD-dependent oxidoreductase [Pseudomonadota bacterium]